MAEVASEGLVVQGTGEAPSRGMRKGSVIDIERAAEAVAEAVDAAERMAGVEVSQVIVGLAGGHIASQASRGLVAVGADAKRIREVRYGAGLAILVEEYGDTVVIDYANRRP